MSLKSNVKAGIIGACRLTGTTALGRFLTRNAFNVVGFHGVSLADEHVRFPTLFISPESFERRLRFLTRHYQVVSLQDVVDQHRAGRIRPRQVVLTFDDGFYNFIERAVPLLEKYRTPATVFVATAEIEAGEPTFNLLAKDIVLSTKSQKATGLPHAPDTTFDLSTSAHRTSVANAVVAALGACASGPEKHEFCLRLGRALQVNVEEKLKARLWDRLTAGELREVVRAGFDVQLHTHSHRNVVEHPERVREEIRRNREFLEGVTGKPATHFCYPLGLWERSAWIDLQAEGVVSAVTTKNGPNFAQTPVLSLRRYLTGEAMSGAEFEFCLSGLEWLGRAAMGATDRFAPQEKRLRYRESSRTPIDAVTVPVRHDRRRPGA